MKEKKTDLLCVHCGTSIPDHGDKCPNCEEDPYHTEPNELLQVHPNDIKKFPSTGKVRHMVTRI